MSWDLRWRLIALPADSVRSATVKECGGTPTDIPARPSEHKPLPDLRLIRTRWLWPMQNVKCKAVVDNPQGYDRFRPVAPCVTRPGPRTATSGSTSRLIAATPSLPGFAQYDLGRVARLIGHLRILAVTPDIVKRYQHDRIKEDAAAKTVNDETGLLLRLCGDQGDAIRSALKRTKCLRLQVPPSPGRPFEPDEQTHMLAVARSSTLAAREACLRQARGVRTPRGAKQGGSPCIFPALVLALNCGLRDFEIRLLTGDQVDFEKRFLTVGQSKTEAGTGRTIPLSRERGAERNRCQGAGAAERCHNGQRRSSAAGPVGGRCLEVWLR